MIWVLIAVMTLAVVAALLWPLLRAPAPAAARAEYDLTVFRDQLDEVERDVARGVLTEGEAEAARIEIKRRMLATSKRADAPTREHRRGRPLMTAALAIVVPFTGLGLYLMVGTPTMPASNPALASQQATEMAGLVDKLAARMKEQPNDPQGWTLLARTYREMQRYPDAAEAYRNLMRLEPDEADHFAGFGEMLTAANGGNVTPEAHAAFVQTLRIARDEPRAQFYLGLEQAQAGETANALAIWRALTASAPPDATWVPTVRNQMFELASSANLPPMGIEPRHALDVVGVSTPAAPAPQAAAANNDPTAPNMNALQGQYSPENIAMIQGMVGGLAAKLEADPSDFNGWMLLGKSYTVIKNTDGAKQAYLHAIMLKPTEAGPRAQLDALVLQDGAAPSPALVKLAAEVRDEPLALYILGQDKAAAGDNAAAQKLWQDASAQLPASAPLKAEIARRVAALK